MLRFAAYALTKRLYRSTFKMFPLCRPVPVQLFLLKSVFNFGSREMLFSNQIPIIFSPSLSSFALNRSIQPSSLCFTLLFSVYRFTFALYNNVSVVLFVWSFLKKMKHQILLVVRYRYRPIFYGIHSNAYTIWCVLVCARVLLSIFHTKKNLIFGFAIFRL